MKKIDAKDQIFINYSHSLTDRIFKILPLYEEKNDGLFRYIQSMLYEFDGLFFMIDKLDNNPEMLSLMATLESISSDAIMFDNEKEVIKREVFKCIDIAKKLNGGE